MEKSKPSLREILTASVLIAVIGVFFILNFIIPAPAVLLSERRIPAKFPELSFKNIWAGEFMKKFDDYAADRFVFRDTFRGIHAFIVFDVFMQTDKSGLYRSDEVGFGEFKRTDPVAFRQTTERIKKAADSLKGYDLNIYYSVVPDKSTFAGRYMPGFDLDLAESILQDVMRDYDYISVADTVEGNSFYRTDLHWDQSKIVGVANHILSGMKANRITGNFDMPVTGSFKGVYAGQYALPVDYDIMTRVEVPGLKVSYLSDKTLEFEPGPVYDLDRINGVDPYDMFLRGPQPLIIIENESAPQRELFLFRDSFGSSLAPLLAISYSKITVIDLRYLHLLLLDQFVDFPPGSDVLFIYSSQIFNNPSILQV